MEEIEIIKKKLKYYKENSIDIHIITKKETFYNGRILEFGGDFLILDDIKAHQSLIFFIEIKDIIPYIDKEERR